MSLQTIIEKISGMRASLDNLLGVIDGKLRNKADAASTYTKIETDARIQMVIGAAPEALDQLAELAAALGNDPNFAGTITIELGKKANKTDVYDKFAADNRFLALSATAANSAKLGNQLPSYYAKKTDTDEVLTGLVNALDSLAEAFQSGATLINGNQP